LSKLTLIEPTGRRINDPSLDTVRQIILSPPAGYWYETIGVAALERYDGPSKKRLMVLPSEQHGFYLKYSDEAKQVWLSLEDPGKLTEVIECADKWYASVGLFLPKEKAWLAIKEFYETGNRSEEITWIDPAEIPEGGSS
jgi:hypothetical protein